MCAFDPSAPAIAFANVEPLIKQSRVLGTSMEFTFACPVTGFEAVASAPVPQQSAVDTHLSAGQIATGMAKTEARYDAFDAVGRVAGAGVGIATEIGANLFGMGNRRKQRAEAGDPAVAAAEPGAAGWHLAAEAAFRSVGDQFRWDAAGGRWVKAP